ncbi:hypothetical protein [Hoeflea prorocentri]|uniref:Uncharacterized protein n=1 Tax=Hoeflea prorocentri TaxID=1922333 RepID=A0A9X3UJB0_9HYPH|nr:hypothetical protein [Hoeflea prorocentri]MCY6382413.1 hypothetical protein [Hoeflea prorocentri]MDA5400213.1 hypothetical protein [Hoeflea prorocentri]
MTGIAGQAVDMGDVDLSAEETLTELLLKLQVELTDIAQLIEAAEHVLCGDEGAPVDPQDIAVVQGMDLAIQRVKGLGDFLAELSTRLPGEMLIDTTTALNVLKLADMQQRLKPGLRPVTQSESVAGDTELF